MSSVWWLACAGDAAPVKRLLKCSRFESAEGKYIVDFAPGIKLEDLKPTLRVALRSDSYQL